MRAPENNLRAGGFTLLELIVVVAIIVVLAGLSVPGYNFIVARAKSTSCHGNLRQLGMALNLYLADHKMIMPDLTAVREDAGDPEEAIDTVLDDYFDDGNDLRCFRCPADHGQMWVETGTSYAWNSVLNGQAANKLQVLGLDLGEGRIPVISDKEAFHEGVGDGVNVLFADGHVENALNFVPEN